jgi:flagellar biosynthesis component FlhA
VLGPVRVHALVTALRARPRIEDPGAALVVRRPELRPLVRSLLTAEFPDLAVIGADELILEEDAQ